MFNLVVKRGDQVEETYDRVTARSGKTNVIT